MFDILNLEQAPGDIVRLMQELQDWTIRDIARRIRQHGTIPPTAEYQIHRLHDLGMFDADLKREIQRALNLSDAQINALYSEAAQSAFLYDKRAFLSHGIPFIPYSENFFLKRMVGDIALQTQDAMRNITRSMGFAVREPGGVVFKPAAQFYQSELDLATMKVSTGVETLEQSIRQAVRKMVESNLRTVDYASGRTDSIDVAARRAVFNGLKELTNRQSDYNSALIGSTLFEISWHGGYRPSHRWGGRRYDTMGTPPYPTEQQLYERYTSDKGEIGTLGDVNCYHIKYAVFPDTPPTYTDAQLDQMHEEQMEKKTFEGREYNQYEARQKQRAIERAMRDSRSIIAGIKGGELEGDLTAARSRYTQQRRKYKEFSAAMGLRTEFERVFTGMV